MNVSARTRTAASCSLLVAALAATAATACDSGGPLSAGHYDAARQVALVGLDDGATADLDRPVSVSSGGDGGRITDVTAYDDGGRYVAGRLSDDGRHWRTTGPLAAGDHYTVRVSTEDENGKTGHKTLTFATGSPRHKKLLTVAFGPKAGEYGVGQPIVAKLSAPVSTRQGRIAVERSLGVRSEPSVEGSWYWVDSRTLHYRPREYWPAHARIEVHSGLKGIRISDTLWGGESRPLRLTTGDAIEALTNAATHTMTVYRNGEDIKDIPVTTGKPGFETRNGTKVVLEKEPFVRMRSETVGIAAGSGDSYDLPVHWATRVTWSGEYVHAAPWSVGSQGSANTSHGCTGMSTENAEWFFNTVREGDIVRVVGSDGERMAPFDNGYGDWNLDWAKWRQGSALLGDGTGPSSGHTVQAARLRPQV